MTLTERLESAGTPEEIRAFREELLRKISWLQHERLIHLIVTCLFAVLLFMVLLGFICFSKAVLTPLIVLLLVLVIPYIAHYYFLENTVQKLYRLFDSMEEKGKKLP